MKEWEATGELRLVGAQSRCCYWNGTLTWEHGDGRDLGGREPQFPPFPSFFSAFLSLPFSLPPCLESLLLLSTSDLF